MYGDNIKGKCPTDRNPTVAFLSGRKFAGIPFIFDEVLSIQNLDLLPKNLNIFASGI